MPHDKYEERNDERKPHTKTKSKSSFANRTSAYRLNCIEQQVPAVQHWNRKKINQSEIDRK